MNLGHARQLTLAILMTALGIAADAGRARLDTHGVGYLFGVLVGR